MPKPRIVEPFAPFRVVVPNRVDLAGGTLDIHPVYLLVPGVMTVNAAIDVNSLVSVRPARSGARLVSGNFPLAAGAADTHGFPTKGGLGLVSCALRFHPPFRGVEIVFRNEAPLGSGIGASSSLLVAAMLAIDALLGVRRGWRETAAAAAEIEAYHLGALTGRQDHVAALRGGIQGIRFLPGRVYADRVGAKGNIGRALEKHGFLAGTGKPHHSGKTNWRMIRGAIEGDSSVIRKLDKVAAAARDAWKALLRGDMDGCGEAIAGEWAVRKTLAPGVTTPRAESAIGSRALRAKVSGAKLCGAGGGGMLFGLLKSPGCREEVEAFLARKGFAVRPFRLSGGPRIERVADDL